METQELADDTRLYRSNERMTAAVGKKSFTCIEYPAVVRDVSKALRTLGGLRTITKNINETESRKKLELRFRPDDVYCKPAYGVGHKVSGLLMRVKRRKKRVQGCPVASLSQSDQCPVAGATPGADEYEYKVEIIGTVSTYFKFEGMCEYQYLPVVRQKDGSFDNLLEKLVMKSLANQSEIMSRKTTLFLPPVVFTRFDFPNNGILLDKQPVKEDLTEPSKTTGYGRRKRQSHTILLNFTDPTPTEPMKAAKENAELFKTSAVKEALEELFKERPIWPKAALVYRLRHTPGVETVLKAILPSIAYIFLTGPWRAFWVKLGYDPRQNPEAKKFQGIDIRTTPRLFHVDTKVKAKRSLLKDRVINKRKDKSLDIDLSLINEGAEQVPESRGPQLKNFEFHPDVMPPLRQLRYMICDIFEPEVEEWAAKNNGKETRCDERDGWCVPNFTDYCRSVMMTYIEKLRADSTTITAVKYKNRKQKMMETMQEDTDDDEDDDEDDDDDFSLDAMVFDDPMS